MVTVCFVASTFPPETHGGAENYVLRVAQALDERGHESIVITTKPYNGRSSLTPERTSYEGVPVWRFFHANVSHRSNGTGSNPVTKALWHALDAPNPHGAAAVKRILDRVDPDVVHTNNLMGLSTLVGRVIQRREVRHVHTLHDYSLICPKSNLLRDLTAPDDELVVCEDPPVPCRAFAREKRALFGTPDVVLAPSQHVLDVHAEHGFFTDTERRRLRLGVEEVVDTVPDLPAEPSVLYAGKIHCAKGVFDLLDAADRLPEVHFDICGKGADSDALGSRAARLDNVTYYGFVSEERLAALRRTSSVGVVSSIWMENSPYTIYESFARGLPMAGSDIGGIPELITPGETGALFAPNDPGNLAATLESVLSDRDRLAAMATNAVAWAHEHTMAAHLDTLVESFYTSASPHGVLP
jgi:glycosyltransferase involved in cell wall biosynthesis